MITVPTKIIVIHDDVFNDSPIIVEMKVKYGEDNVLLFRHSQEGLDYVLTHLGKKMVVLLDKNFHDGKEKSGLQVFEEIRNSTSLVYVILTTVSKLNEFDEVDLKRLINNDLFAFESFTSDYHRIMDLIDHAVQKLEVRVDAVLEEWIANLSDEERNKPYLTTREGKSYTLTDILTSIREQSELGKHLERNFLKLTVHLITKEKTRLND